MTELHFAQEQLVYLISFLVKLPNCIIIVYHDDMAANFKP